MISKFVTSVKDLVLISAPYALLSSTLLLSSAEEKESKGKKRHMHRITCIDQVVTSYFIYW